MENSIGRTQKSMFLGFPSRYNMKCLTRRQSNIMEFIIEHWDKNGDSPTRYEIRDAMQKKWFKYKLSRQAIDNHLTLLKEGRLRFS